MKKTISREIMNSSEWVGLNTSVPKVYVDHVEIKKRNLQSWTEMEQEVPKLFNKLPIRDNQELGLCQLPVKVLGTSGVAGNYHID